MNYDMQYEDKSDKSRKAVSALHYRRLERQSTTCPLPAAGEQGPKTQKSSSKLQGNTGGVAHEQARKWIISSMTGLPRSKTRRFPQIAEKWHPQRDSNPCCRDENPVS